MQHQQGIATPSEPVLIAAVVLTASLLADAVTKSLAVHLFADAPLTFGLLHFDVVKNPAFAFSMGEGLIGDRAVALARAFGVLLIVVFLRSAVIVDQAIRTLSGYALVAAGGLGNTLDHVTQDGAVVDFIGVKHTPAAETAAIAFNVADISVVLGIALIYPAIRAYALRLRRRRGASASAAPNQQGSAD